MESVTNAGEFAQWSLDTRGPECRMIGNGTDEMTSITAWVKDSLTIPDGVRVVRQYEAEGTAPAMRDNDVEGWNKYELELENAE